MINRSITIIAAFLPVLAGLGEMAVKAGVPGNTTSRDMLVRLDRDVLSKRPEFGLAPGGRSDGHIHFPIKIRSITVDMNRRKLDLIDFKPTVPIIRLGPIVAK